MDGSTSTVPGTRGWQNTLFSGASLTRFTGFPPTKRLCRGVRKYSFTMFGSHCRFRPTPLRPFTPLTCSNIYILSKARRWFANVSVCWQARAFCAWSCPTWLRLSGNYLGREQIGESSTGRELVEPADRFNQRLLMRPPAPPSGNLMYRWYTAVADFHQHKWMYDENSLKALLQAAGFTDVERMPLHTSRIAGIESIEHPSRVANGQGICVEGVKP